MSLAYRELHEVGLLYQLWTSPLQAQFMWERIKILFWWSHCSLSCLMELNPKWYTEAFLFSSFFNYVSCSSILLISFSFFFFSLELEGYCFWACWKELYQPKEGLECHILITSQWFYHSQKTDHWILQPHSSQLRRHYIPLGHFENLLSHFGLLKWLEDVLAFCGLGPEIFCSV